MEKQLSSKYFYVNISKLSMNKFYFFFLNEKNKCTRPYDAEVIFEIPVTSIAVILLPGKSCIKPKVSNKSLYHKVDTKDAKSLLFYYCFYPGEILRYIDTCGVSARLIALGSILVWPKV